MYGRHQIKQNKLSTRQSTLGILREVDSRIKTKKKNYKKSTRWQLKMTSETAKTRTGRNNKVPYMRENTKWSGDSLRQGPRIKFCGL